MARYKRGKRSGNLNKQHFFNLGVLSSFLGSSLVHPWFVPGLLPEGHREGTRGRNLNKSTFINTHTFGGRAYPVRHYPIAIRLRTRKGCAILCIALNPQSGDFSGAILGVRSVALLHLGL